MSELSLFILTSVVLTVFGILFLIYFKNNFLNGLREKIVCAILFLLFIRFLSLYVYINGIINDYPHFLLVDYLVFRLIMPLFFFSVYLKFYPRKLKWIDSIHLLPFIAFFLNFLPVFFSDSKTKQELIQQVQQNGISEIWSYGILFSEIGIFFLRLIPLVIYLCCIVFIFVWNSNFKLLSPNSQRFYKLLFAYIGINFFAFLLLDSPLLNLVSKAYWVDFITFFTAVPLIVFPFFNPYFLEGYQVAHTMISSDESTDLLDDGKEKEIPEDEIEPNMESKIQELIKVKKIFLNPDLSLSDFEKELGISGRYISEAIKRSYGVSFNHLINQKRIEFFKEYVAKRSNTSKKVYLIYSEVGFKSITNFYAYSKKFLGVTPAEYIQQQKRRKN